MYSCGGSCKGMEDHVQLWRAMYICGGSCIDMEGHV